MTDTTNTADAAAEETLLEKFEDGLEHLGAEVVEKIKNAVLTFEVKYQPYVKAFFVTLFTQEGKDAMDAAIVAVPTGSPSAIAAAVAAAIVGSLGANVVADAKAEFAQAEKDDAAAAAAASSTTVADQAAS